MSTHLIDQDLHVTLGGFKIISPRQLKVIIKTIASTQNSYLFSKICQHKSSCAVGRIKDETQAFIAVIGPYVAVLARICFPYNKKSATKAIMKYWIATICPKALEVPVAVIQLKAKSASMQPMMLRTTKTMTRTSPASWIVPC
jgi:hypothetical protein